MSAAITLGSTVNDTSIVCCSPVTSDVTVISPVRGPGSAAAELAVIVKRMGVGGEAMPEKGATLSRPPAEVGLR